MTQDVSWEERQDQQAIMRKRRENNTWPEACPIEDGDPRITDMDRQYSIPPTTEKGKIPVEVWRKGFYTKQSEKQVEINGSWYNPEDIENLDLRPENPCGEVFKAPGNPEPYEYVDPDYSCPTHTMQPIKMIQPPSNPDACPIEDGYPRILSNEDQVAVGDLSSDAKGSGARKNSGKVSFSGVPLHLLAGTARVLMHGSRKYKAWNWAKGMAWSVCFDCAMRHMFKWFYLREECDDESGEHHLDHAICNLLFLRHYDICYKEGDDRPPTMTDFHEALDFFNTRFEETK